MSDGEQTKQGQGLPVIDRSRALVFVERRGKRSRSAVPAQAHFVAQLIASEARLGEYRQARREDPLVGSRRYRSAEAPPAPGFQVQV